MDLGTALGTGFATGLGVAYIAIRLFPAVMGKRWREDVAQEMAKSRREAKHRREEDARKALEASSPNSAGAMEALESYRAMITRFDVQRGSTISLTSRCRDLASDIRHDRRLRHLIQIVFCDWNIADGTIWRDAALAKFVHKVYEEEPSLPFLLDQSSILPVIELIYAAERGQPPQGETRPPLDTMEAIHARFVPEARRFFEGLIDDEKVADSIADACVERLEKAISKVVGASTAAGAEEGASLSHLAPSAPPASSTAPAQSPRGLQPTPAKPAAIPPTTPPAPMPPTSSSAFDSDVGPPGPDSAPGIVPGIKASFGESPNVFGAEPSEPDFLASLPEPGAGNPFFSGPGASESAPGLGGDFSGFGAFMPGGMPQTADGDAKEGSKSAGG